MSHSSPAGMTTEQLGWINDELLACVQAGIPLDRGLQFASRDLSGQLRTITRELGDRLERGETLEEALRHQPGIPSAYRALVVAGIRSQRLPDVMRQTAQSLKRLSQVQTTIRRSFAYPLLIVTLTYALFLASVVWLTPRVAASYRELLLRDTLVSEWLAIMAETVGWWWPVPPTVILLGFLLITRRFPLLPFSTFRKNHSPWTPWRKLEHLGHLALFSETLALLVDQEEPLPSALNLAAEASGSERIRSDGMRLAKQLEQGERARTDPLPQSLIQSFAWPPLLTWLLLSSRDSTSLSHSLHRFSRNLQRNAERQAMTISFLYPVIIGTLVAGIALLAYALWVITPWYMLLHYLTPTS